MTTTDPYAWQRQREQTQADIDEQNVRVATAMALIRKSNPHGVTAVEYWPDGHIKRIEYKCSASAPAS